MSITPSAFVCRVRVFHAFKRILLLANPYLHVLGTHPWFGPSNLVFLDLKQKLEYARLIVSEQVLASFHDPLDACCVACNATWTHIYDTLPGHIFTIYYLDAYVLCIYITFIFIFTCEGNSMEGTIIPLLGI